MRYASMFLGLFALVCSFGAVDAKTASHPIKTLNKPASDEAKTVSNPDMTL